MMGRRTYNGTTTGIDDDEAVILSKIYTVLAQGFS